jgi:predicted transposase YbfD/YdcC
MRVNKASGRTIHIDGKTIYGSASKGWNGVHIVSAWVSAQNIVLGQVKTGEKSNEITAIPELLDSLEVKGDTITIDAMGCQRDRAAKIREQGANYVLSVKENQPTVYQEIKEYFECVEEDWERNPPTDVWRSGLEKNHGRQESREVLTEEDISWLNGKEQWKDIRTIIWYRRRSEEEGKPTVDNHDYISNRGLDAEEAAHIIRGHWSIENGLHWFLDVCFGEDACRARTNHAAENLNVLRKAALHLLRKTAVPEKRFSVRRKMFRAAFSDDFLYHALFG